MTAPRICHVSTVHRGVEIRIVRKELASLAAAGYDAHAIISATPEEIAEAARLGVTIHPLAENARTGGRLTRMTRKMFDAWRSCRKLDARLYHFHDPELIPLGLLLKLSGYKTGSMSGHEKNGSLQFMYVGLNFFEPFGVRFAPFGPFIAPYRRIREGSWKQSRQYGRPSRRRTMGSAVRSPHAVQAREGLMRADEGTGTATRDTRYSSFGEACR